MFRTLLYLLLTIFVLSFVRMIAGVVMKGVGEMVNPGSAAGTGHSPRQRPSEQDVPSGGELKRDPICGTYVPSSTPHRKTSGSSVMYFCSADCRDKFHA